jgi:MYXO-CTERM domain-containing protein
LAQVNQRIAASLYVDRRDGVNVLTWGLQSDVAGYQVFSADSPFVLLDEVPGDRTTWSDPNGSRTTRYLVTAFFDDLSKLTADLVNAGQVPGYSGVPEGQKASAPGGFIPGPSPLLLVGLLGLAALLARRRKA